MRTILLALLSAAGLGLLGAYGAAASPVGGSASATNPATGSMSVQNQQQNQQQRRRVCVRWHDRLHHFRETSHRRQVKACAEWK